MARHQHREGAKRGEQLPAKPFVLWIRNELERIEAVEAYTVITADGRRTAKGAHAELAYRLGVDSRQLWRWKNQLAAGSRNGHKGDYPTETFPRAGVEDALDHAGIFMWEVYPHLDEDVKEPEEFCWACRAFVTPIHGRCPWCEDPLVRLDLSSLPPRQRAEAEAEEPKWRVTKKRRRVKKGKPFWLDLDLEIRRAALEVYVATGVRKDAGRYIAQSGLWSSDESGANAIWTLQRREGWTTLRKVERALHDGSWITITRRPPKSQVKVFDEALLREAAWLYFYEDLGVDRIAQRLLGRSNTNKWQSLKAALNKEWHYRGWPKRTKEGRASLHYWKEPREGERCKAINASNGKPCRCWPTKGKDVCSRHDPEMAEARKIHAKAASDKAFEDAVPLEPFGYWLRLRAKEVGSMAEVHRRLGEGVIDYSILTGYAGVWAEAPGMKSRTKGERRGQMIGGVVRRSTVDRILEAWGDGTTFEDVYMPLADDAEIAESVAANGIGERGNGHGPSERRASQAQADAQEHRAAVAGPA